MRIILIVMLMLSASISFAQNTGIGTITPTEKLDIAAGNVRIRNISTNPGAAGTDKTVVADANGVLKTLATTNTLTAVNGNLISTVNGLASTPAVPILATANNGLNAVAADVRLGGTLSAPTTIATSAVNTLAASGLQNATSSVGTVVVDANGVLKLKTAASISSVRVTGDITFTNNDQFYFINNNGTMTETFDNLNEFAGAQFTAVQTGLYQFNFSVNFAQSSNGAAYLGKLNVLSGNAATPSTYTSGNSKISGAVGTALSDICSVTDIVKLTAGQVIQFQAGIYQTTGGLTGKYVVSITRVD
ncbi:hypothetical protein FA048_09605 [Pedobacter polaris]|uniref:C1q domain-containing protein n=1 Tax=Pedobacter polaris TaxID=2571273 RepID=A0A4U1CTL9_9SPHI|nr:hypothetical protein [Pedobacter polaris]TKC10435.1 hypothetical protein FA048_09605 [Pedobacter polaris]